MLDKNELITILSLENSTAFSNDKNILINYIKERLTANGISFDIQKDKNVENIYSFKKNKPLFFCHTDSMKLTSVDSVIKGKALPITIVDDKGKISALRGKKKSVLGGDDACGVFILLNLIESGKDISFAFFSNEETGMEGSRSLMKVGMEFPYAILVDRAGNSNIICKNNNYGTKEFEDALSIIGEEFLYSPTSGYCSDADVVRRYACTANISCGFYEAHSTDEYVIYEDVINAYNFCNKIIQEFSNKTFEASAEIFTPYSKKVLSKDLISFIQDEIGVLYNIVNQTDIIDFIRDSLSKK